MERSAVAHASFDFDASRWVDAVVDLPVAHDGTAVILTPKRFLKRLPTMSKEGLRDYLWAQEGETLRVEFGYDVKRQVSMSAIVAIARRRRDLVDAFRNAMTNVRGAYPIDRDPVGLYQPYVAARQLALADAFIPPSVDSLADLRDFTRFLIEDFRHSVEERRQSMLLWNDNGEPRHERASKLAFYARAEVHCTYASVSITMEADTGAGPVDIYLSKERFKSLVEMKLMSNSKYWHGLDVQLPAYVAAARPPVLGSFLGIALSEAHVTGDRYTTLASRARTTGRTHRQELAGTPIDARIRPSASHL